MTTAVTPPAAAPANDVVALVPAADQRHALLAEVAPVLTGFLLHDWREAARGDDAAELILLWVLHTGGVGEPRPDLSVADELDSRLEPWPSRPDDLDTRTVGEGAGAAALELQQSPDSPAAARRYVRYRTLAAGPARWPGPDLRRVVEGQAPDPASPWEVLPVLLDDAARIAAGDRSRASLEAAADHLEGAEIFVGRLVPVDRPGWSPSGPRLRAAIQTQRWEEFWPLFLERQRETLGLLLRGNAAPHLPGPNGWLAWAEGEPGAVGARSRAASRPGVRVVVLALMVAVGVVLAAVPHRLPGRLPDARLTHTPGPTLLGVSLHRADKRTYVNVALQSSPRSVTFRLTFDGSPEQLTAVQDGATDSWHIDIAPSPNRPLGDVTINTSGTRVVIALPGSFDPAGVAVSLPDGERAPQQGFSPRQTEPKSRVNLVDLIVVVAVGLGAWRGWKSGAVQALSDLVAYLAILVLTRVAYAPVSHGLHSMLDLSWRVADGLAFAVLFIVVGFVLQRLARRRLTAALTRMNVGHPLARTADGLLGALVRMVDVLLVINVVLVVVVDLAALGGAAGAVESSFLGRALVSMTRTAFGGL